MISALLVRNATQPLLKLSRTALLRALASPLTSIATSAAAPAMASAPAARAVKEWHSPPDQGHTSQLLLLNSLTDEKVPFVPAAGVHSKAITWYTCGPTVYDVAHLGHARNYVTFDIVRRVLEDYFGYNIQFIMNVTDVDDKIILRARRNHLMAQYRAQAHTPAQVLELAQASVHSTLAKQEAKCQANSVAVQAAAAESAQAGGKGNGERRRKELESTGAGEALKLAQLQAAADSLAALKLTGSACADVDTILALAGDAVAESLDAQHGSEVTDQSIFRAHAAKYEREFFEDLDSLNCRKPDVLTRVSEYVPEIVAYVEKIVANGMGYAANGSVYFDTKAFSASGHTYGKLKPWAVGSNALAAESESNFETIEKRSSNDFALWKASKPGEPFWDSPWGPGRPGWHIECSAMACAVAGNKLDIHTGGDDLKFPHHDNELAQAEAYYHDSHVGCSSTCQQWVNYFLHSGHLSIEGLKMSKSLKNFITVREALKGYSARQLRLLFAQSSWNKPMVYGESSRQEMHAKEQLFRNFFQNVDVALRSSETCAGPAKWEAEDEELNRQVLSAQEAVHAHLLDNIDTGKALDAVCGMIHHVNVYLAGRQGVPVSPQQSLVLRKASAFATKILSVMGIVDGQSDRLGLGDAAGGSGGAAASATGAKYLDAFSAFRDEMRSLARGLGAAGKDIMLACDSVRDATLVDLGVRLEDKPNGPAVWKLDDPAVLRGEAAERAAAAAAAVRKKLANALELRTKERDKFERLAALPPPAQALAEKFSQFDPTSGEPTHDKAGAALDGKALSKAKKDFEKLKKEREPLEKKVAEDPSFLATLAADVAQLTAQLAALDASTAAAASQGPACANGSKA